MGRTQSQTSGSVLIGVSTQEEPELGLEGLRNRSRAEDGSAECFWMNWRR